MAFRTVRLSFLSQCSRRYSTIPPRKPFQVAIDGPAASGKSTTAKLVAQKLGFDYIDTGAFYRCVTLATLRAGIDPSMTTASNTGAITDLAAKTKIGLETVFNTSPADTDVTTTTKKVVLPTTRVYLDDADVSSEIRTTQVSQHVSAVAAIPGVRSAVLDKVRAIGARDIAPSTATTAQTSTEATTTAATNVATTPTTTPQREGLVMDGRDIGTVVLPHADLKIFLVADSRVRAERRLQEMIRNGEKRLLLSDEEKGGKEREDLVEQVRQDLERRDELDRTRKVSPLKKAVDAVELDTSNLTIAGQVEAIVQEAQRRRAISE
ncbi:hypothetical protein DFQ27_005044 [Actinomortierella ambigua]|uniref:(d)CMP kinase n=1 Tax=Actinomortierella ambigua TaxID=1343610 RepID=A0A9P6Q3Z1_9FUNG|nr:hypothetical protein DFQ27_005044 [Actinomortierella ambigua]